jgi:mycoredoxin
MSGIIMYGTTWCNDCTRAKRFLDSNDIEYSWINIDQETQYVDCVIKINDGLRIVPTIVFADGSVLTEPSDRDLALKLNLQDK